MTRAHRIRRRCAAILAALTAAITWAGWPPAAFAAAVPPPGTTDVGRDVPLVPAPAVAMRAVHGWQAILIAIGAVLAGSVLAVLYDRGRAARQGRVAAHATRA